MSCNIESAIVLAAGFGTRMMPLTADKPKACVQVAGKPLIGYALDHLQEYGINNPIINGHYKADVLQDTVNALPNLRPTFSIEQDILETGGGIKNALHLIDNEFFFAVNCDSLWLNGDTPALNRLTDAWQPDVMDVLLLTCPVENAYNYTGNGDFDIDDKGKLTRRLGNTAPLIYMGVQIVKKSMFNDTPEGAFSNNYIFDKARLYGVVHDDAWFHISTPSDVEFGDDNLR